MLWRECSGWGPLGLAAAPLTGTEGVRTLPKSQRRRDGEITIRCPDCGYESRTTIAWARGRMKMQCAGCGDEFYLHKTKIRKALDAVMKAFGHHQ